MTDKGGKKAGIFKIVGLGCAGCLVSVLVVGAVVVVIGGFVFQMMKTSHPYEEALDRVRNDQRVVEAIGEPIEPGLLVLGSIETTGPSGEASISFPISAPKGKAKVFVEAEKSAGKWKILVLEVEIRGIDDRIDLMD